MRVTGTQATCLCVQRASSLQAAASAGRMPASRTAWMAVFRFSDLPRLQQDGRIRQWHAAVKKALGIEKNTALSKKTLGGK
jgi:hypothetical protein